MGIGVGVEPTDTEVMAGKTGDFFWLIATKRLEAPKPTRLPKIIAKINPLSIL